MPSMNGRDSRPAGDSTGRPDASGAPTTAVAVTASGKKRARGTRSLPRAERKHEQAAAEVGKAEGAPGLGSLNRNLKLVVEQLATAHRILGQVAAERDALRQQLADLLGVPIEEIVVPSAGAPTVPHESGPQPDAAPAEAAEGGIGRIGRIRRRLPDRWRHQNSPRS